MPMRPCNQCLNNNWDLKPQRILNDDGTKEKWVEATCNICGFEVEFGHKKIEARPAAKASYEIRDGKRFLGIDGEMKEVGLFMSKKGTMRVFSLDSKRKDKWRRIDNQAGVLIEQTQEQLILAAENNQQI